MPIPTLRLMLPPVLLALALPAAAQEREPILAERSTVALPSWDDAVATTDVERYADASEYATAVADPRYVLEKLRYRSDGLVVVAYLYRPREAAGPARPVVVFNRGSWVRGDIAPELVAMFRRLADAGFTTVAPMLRGSAGGEGHDAMGGADLDDLMIVPALLAGIDGVDTGNLFLYGESRGGMMVFQAIRDGFPARAAATWGAFADLDALASTDRGLATARAIWPDFDARRAEIVTRRSAIRWPDKLDVPLLLMHGGADASVPPIQTLRLATALLDAGKEAGVVVFPGGNHTLDHDRVERDRVAVEFFRRHLRR